MKFRLKKELILVSATLISGIGLLMLLFDDMYSGRWDYLTRELGRVDSAMASTLIVLIVLLLALLIVGIYQVWDRLRWYWWFKKRRQNTTPSKSKNSA